MTLRGRLRQAFHPRPHFLPDNEIWLLCNGADYFRALLADIDNARETIRLETYLYADDSIGDALTQALCRAAARGVDVRIVVDGFGARNLDQRHRSPLESAGVQIRVFRPERELLRHLISLKRARLRRMHRKLALIDGRSAFAGGINIIDDATGNTDSVRLDFAVRIRGPLIEPIGHAIDRQWLMLTRFGSILRKRYTKPLPTTLHVAPTGDRLAALVLRDNLLHRRAIEYAYLLAIRQAHEQITLAMAYFIPSQKILTELLEASQRGVRVTLLLQGRVEYRLQHYAAQALYATLLTHGIRIFEYRPGFMHAKAAVIDGIWSTVGSANLDPFSLLVAREANIVIRDQPFAATLQSQLDLAISTHSREITLDVWQKKPKLHHLLRGACALLLYRALRLTGYADTY
ncbi:MAG: cardiolipin synthase [Pseudomonadota bacterium]|jgi:cardiolipin synthase